MEEELVGPAVLDGRPPRRDVPDLGGQDQVPRGRHLHPACSQGAQHGGRSLGGPDHRGVDHGGAPLGRVPQGAVGAPAERRLPEPVGLAVGHPVALLKAQGGDPLRLPGEERFEPRPRDGEDPAVAAHPEATELVFGHGVKAVVEESVRSIQAADTQRGGRHVDPAEAVVSHGRPQNALRVEVKPADGHAREPLSPPEDSEAVGVESDDAVLSGPGPDRAIGGLCGGPHVADHVGLVGERQLPGRRRPVRGAHPQSVAGRDPHPSVASHVHGLRFAKRRGARRGHAVRAVDPAQPAFMSDPHGAVSGLVHEALEAPGRTRQPQRLHLSPGPPLEPGLDVEQHRAVGVRQDDVDDPGPLRCLIPEPSDRGRPESEQPSAGGGHPHRAVAARTDRTHGCRRPVDGDAVAQDPGPHGSPERAVDPGGRQHGPPVARGRADGPNGSLRIDHRDPTLDPPRGVGPVHERPLGSRVNPTHRGVHPRRRGEVDRPALGAEAVQPGLGRGPHRSVGSLRRVEELPHGRPLGQGLHSLRCEPDQALVRPRQQPARRGRQTGEPVEGDGGHLPVHDPADRAAGVEPQPLRPRSKALGPFGHPLDRRPGHAQQSSLLRREPGDPGGVGLHRHQPIPGQGRHRRAARHVEAGSVEAHQPVEAGEPQQTVGAERQSVQVVQGQPIVDRPAVDHPPRVVGGLARRRQNIVAEQDRCYDGDDPDPVGPQSTPLLLLFIDAQVATATRWMVALSGWR